jgi:hypothetical protein
LPRTVSHKRRIHPGLRAAVWRSGRTQAELAAECGFPRQCSVSVLLRQPFTWNAFHVLRVQRLADAVGYEGPVLR